jgi:hypothetical protein
MVCFLLGSRSFRASPNHYQGIIYLDGPGVCWHNSLRLGNFLRWLRRRQFAYDLVDIRYHVSRLEQILPHSWVSTWHSITDSCATRGLLQLGLQLSLSCCIMCASTTANSFVQILLVSLVYQEKIKKKKINFLIILFVSLCLWKSASSTKNSTFEIA